MNINFILGLGFGMLGALFINIGKGVQKQKVHIFLTGKKIVAPENRRDLYIWLIGLSMTAFSSVPTIIGIKLSESPSAISAMTGIGLIGLAIYALLILGEKMGPIDIIGILLVISGTTILGYLGAGKTIGAREFTDSTLLLTVAGLTGFYLVGCLTALVIKPLHGVTFGLAAGTCIGLAFFLLDAGFVRSNRELLAALKDYYPYLALLYGTAATAITQLGFLRARALEVAPAVNSSIIFTPIILEGVVYGAAPETITLVFIGVILVGVFLLSIGSAAKVSG